MISRSERLLAALIFVLWSLGVVVLPALERGQSIVPMWNLLQQWLLIVYFGLQMVTLCYAVYALAGRLRHWPRRGTGWRVLVSPSLYVYAIMMILVSLSLLWPTIFPSA